MVAAMGGVTDDVSRSAEVAGSEKCPPDWVLLEKWRRKEGEARKKGQY